LFDRHAGVLVLLARQWCATPEDVVQEAFLKLTTSRPVPENPAAWLYTVVRHGAISTGRSTQRRRQREQRAGQLDWFQHDPGQQLDAEQAVESLQKLSEEERAAIIAHLWGGLSFEAIAQMLGTSSSSAHRLYTRGLDQLRVLLGESIHVT
jgi:RNA polymerase sigma-70 factor (ECF subfamily)